MRSKACLLVFDGLADWEPALAQCEINKSTKYEVVTVGFSSQAVTTMGGYRLSPHATLDSIDPGETSILILPGGEMWEQGPNEKLTALLKAFHARNTILAAICGATLAIARAGLMNGLGHTSNSKVYLRAMIPDYTADTFYVEQLATTDRNLITASGLGSVEFACGIVRALGIYNEKETGELFDMFKHGIIPARYAG